MICQVPLKTIQKALITIFKTWGVPRWIKVDNGKPFGDPFGQVIPVLALWLIGLDIQVIWNRVRIPQDNAKVERGQGTLSRWTEWSKCHDAFDLQYRVWQQAAFHNLHYPVSRLRRQTRVTYFSGLLHAPRSFHPERFDINRVLKFVATGAWIRKVSKVGQLTMWGQRFTVGQQYKHQQVSINLDPDTNHWLVYDQTGTLIKQVKSHITKVNVWNLDLSAP